MLLMGVEDEFVFKRYWGLGHEAKIGHDLRILNKPVLYLVEYLNQKQSEFWQYKLK